VTDFNAPLPLSETDLNPYYTLTLIALTSILISLALTLSETTPTAMMTVVSNLDNGHIQLPKVTVNEKNH